MTNTLGDGFNLATFIVILLFSMIEEILWRSATIFLVYNVCSEGMSPVPLGEGRLGKIPVVVKTIRVLGADNLFAQKKGRRWGRNNTECLHRSSACDQKCRELHVPRIPLPSFSICSKEQTNSSAVGQAYPVFNALLRSEEHMEPSDGSGYIPAVARPPLYPESCALTTASLLQQHRIQDRCCGWA